MFGVMNLMNGVLVCVNVEGMLFLELIFCLIQRGWCVVFRKIKFGGEGVVVVIVGDNNGFGLVDMIMIMDLIFI